MSETRLYYELKAAFAEIDVIYHHRSDWLGRQHLDVAIPDLRIALEFQGAQHEKPVAFFAGEKAFARTQEREHRKLGKCAKQGWRMSYVREGYDFAGLVANIIATP